MPENWNMPEGKVFTLNDFYFDLPEELIAQYPAESREKSRLLVLDRSDSSIVHSMFSNISCFLQNGDVLVVNNAKVIPARIYFKRQSGALVEFVLNRNISPNKWLVISNRTKRLKQGEVLYAERDESVTIRILARINENLEVESNIEFTDDVLKRIGNVPLPPYIKRDAGAMDEERYQTVYSEQGMAAAAPTAGLHFTKEILTELQNSGIKIVPLTLDVSWGTFQPVRDNDLSKNKMHIERYYLSEKSAGEINSARKEQRRIIAVGTTSLRVLESTYERGENIPGYGETDIFIYPPFKIKSIDAMITNFHTPYSTLLMLVSSFAGYDKIMNAYETAVKEKYRFFSYGDAMLIK